MKEPSLFPPELRTMSVVPRWSIVNTLTRDTLTNHSYFVAMYAMSIARLIKWQGNYGDLCFIALTHDCDETVTGDIPGPAKHEIIDSARAEDYVYARMKERLGYIVDALSVINEDAYDEMAHIVKCADRLDALVFMIMEKRLGNGVIADHIPRSWKQTEAAFRALDNITPEDTDMLWNTYMVPAIREHETTGGFGIP